MMCAQTTHFDSKPELHFTSHYTILASKAVSDTVAEVSAKLDTVMGTEVRA